MARQFTLPLVNVLTFQPSLLYLFYSVFFLTQGRRGETNVQQGVRMMVILGSMAGQLLMDIWRALDSVRALVDSSARRSLLVSRGCKQPWEQAKLVSCGWIVGSLRGY